MVPSTQELLDQLITQGYGITLPSGQQYNSFNAAPGQEIAATTGLDVMGNGSSLTPNQPSGTPQQQPVPAGKEQVITQRLGGTPQENADALSNAWKEFVAYQKSLPKKKANVNKDNLKSKTRLLGAPPLLDEFINWVGDKGANPTNGAQSTLNRSFGAGNQGSSVKDGSRDIGGLGRAAQMPRYTKEQQAILSGQVLPQLTQALQRQPEYDFAPIQQQAEREFREKTIPGIANQFTTMGGEGLRGSAFYRALGNASAGLHENLSSMKSQYGQQNEGLHQARLNQLLGAGLQPSFENIFAPKAPSTWQSLAPGLGAGVGAGLAYGVKSGLGF